MVLNQVQIILLARYYLSFPGNNFIDDSCSQIVYRRLTKPIFATEKILLQDLSFPYTTQNIICIISTSIAYYKNLKQQSLQTILYRNCFVYHGHHVFEFSLTIRIVMITILSDIYIFENNALHC